MNRILTVAKWQVRNSRKAIIIFHAILFGFVGFLAYMAWRFGGSVTTGGLDMNGFIFCFVLGLTSFKNTFKFTQANNVSRRSMFFASLISLPAIAAIMAIAYIIFNALLGLVIPHQGLLPQIYSVNAWPINLLWSFGLNTFAIFLGFLITLIYYRSNALQKTIVSISPFFLIFGLVHLDGRTNGRLGDALVRFFRKAFGLVDLSNPNPYIALLSFLISAAIFAAFSFLLMRRAPIRD